MRNNWILNTLTPAKVTGCIALILACMSESAPAQNRSLDMLELEVKVSENVKSGKPLFADVTREIEFALDPKTNSKKQLRNARIKIEAVASVKEVSYDKKKALLKVTVDAAVENTAPETFKEILIDNKVEIVTISESYFTRKD